MAWDILPKGNLQYFLTKLKNKFLMLTNYNKLGAKNILPYPYAYGSGTVHGLTVTVNDDGSVTASGQPTQNVAFTLVSNIITEYSLQVGDKLIFSESNVENNNASAALVYVSPSGAISLVQGDYELTVTSDMVTRGVAFILWFNTGVDLSTAVTFKPMLRLATDPDSTWASPAFTNRKLTELVVYLNRTKSHVVANPSTTTDTLSSVTIDGTAYAIQGGGGSNVQADWDETDPTDDSYIQNNPKEYLDHHVSKNMMYIGRYSDLGVSGCTIRVQYYGEVVINGTCTADGGAGYCILGQIIQWYGLKVGDVIVFSEKYGYDADKCYFAYRDFGSNTWYPIHDDYEYTVTGNEVINPEAGAIQFGIYVKANTFDNHILRPMCRLKGQDDSWAYAAPNDIHTGLWINALRNGTARDNTKVAKSGDTMTGVFTVESNSDTPFKIKIKSDTGKCYMGFYNNSGALGYFTVGPDHKPYFYHSSDKRIALLDDISSTCVAKSGDTMSGTLYFSNYNDVAICLNSSGDTYKTTISHQNAGNEATVFATKNSVTSFIFINGEDSLNNHANNRWQNITPALQIKQGCVAINKLIGQGTSPTYNLEVNGTTKSTTFVGNLQYAHTNEINFSGGNQNTCYFNYRNADTDSASAVSSIAYKFCNYSNDTSKSNILAGYFNGYTINASVPSGAVFTDANVRQIPEDGTHNWNLRLLGGGHVNDSDYTENTYKCNNLIYNTRNCTLYVHGTYGFMHAPSKQNLYFGASDESNYYLYLGVRDSAWTLCPNAKDYIRLGTANYRWNQIYSNNTSISTSDRNEKKDIKPLDEFARTLVMALKPVSFKFINGESGRTHYGMIAQDVEESLEELGITPMDIAGFCKDQKTKQIKEICNGQEKFREIKLEGQYTYGLRYGEFLAPVIKTVQLQQEDINSLKEEISLLKEEIALLKHRIDILEDK